MYMRLGAIRNPYAGKKIGIGASKSAAPVSGRFPGSQCPNGLVMVRRERERVANPGYIGAPLYEDFVVCGPAPSAPAAPAAPAPDITVSPHFNVSPNVQTEVSPQISPAFFQAQDSPGAAQAANPTQSGGGQSASSGAADNSALLEQMRLDREAQQAQWSAMLEAQRIQQENDAAAAERARQDAAAERARRDEEAAALQQQYDAALKSSQQAVPSTYTTTISPGRQMVPPTTGNKATPVAPVKVGLNWPVVIGAVTVGGAVLYFALRRKR